MLLPILSLLNPSCCCCCSCCGSRLRMPSRTKSGIGISVSASVSITHVFILATRWYVRVHGTQALMKLVSEGVLEKVKHSFRLSHKCIAAKEKEKARAKEEASQRKTAVGGASGSRQQVMVRTPYEREEEIALPDVGSVSSSVFNPASWCRYSTNTPMPQREAHGRSLVPKGMSRSPRQPQDVEHPRPTEIKMQDPSAAGQPPPACRTCVSR